MIMKNYIKKKKLFIAIIYIVLISNNNTDLQKRIKIYFWKKIIYLGCIFYDYGSKWSTIKLKYK